MTATDRETQTDTRAAAIWGILATLIIALWAWSFTLSGRLAAVETKADAVVKATEYYQSIDRRLSRIEGKLGLDGVER